MQKNIFLSSVLLLVALLGGYYFWAGHVFAPAVTLVVDPSPTDMTLSATYTCLPLLDNSEPQPDDCVFGLKTDAGEYYMVNFGQSAQAMEEFQKGAHIVAEGFFMSKESLSTDQWKQYNMKGIFTVTKKITVEEPISTSTLVKPQPTPIKPPPAPVACSEEARLCPDGSSVVRSGPKCEFAVCPAVNPPAVICDYAAPPAGCNYVAGPNYNTQTMCGMVLNCSNSTEATLKEGERQGPLLVQKIYPTYITGLSFREYPIATAQGESVTLQIGETVSNGCTVSLTLVKITDSTAVFTETIDNNKICPICLSRDTLIDTKQGFIAVQDIQVGTLVWSENKEGKRTLEPVIKISKTIVPPNHKVVDLVLDNGRRLQVSPLHPTADGRTVGELVVGDRYDGAKVISAELVSYKFDATYDLLPAGETGRYLANGILLNSTLH